MTALAQDRASDAPNTTGRKYPARIYNATRLSGPAPAIDGRLDDAAWKAEGDWAGEWRQNTPVEGAQPSAETQLKILYDDHYVYAAIRAFDDPAKVHRYPGRRDDFNGFAVDIVGVAFNSYNDKKTGFEFDLTAGGAKLDLVLGNGENEWDATWDAVWDGEVAHDDRGWTAEFRIPLSQLRYRPEDEQVWGMHAWRWIARNGEEDQWQLIPRQHTGLMYQMGELRGIRGLPPSRHIEVLPHVLGKAAPGTSTIDGRTTMTAGVDAKLGIASNFTLDATVNPDFGQVEADPSVMNLTAYETFYDEKRPFFLEGRKTLTFGFDGSDQIFHSRRIGGAPSFAPLLDEQERASVPESTAILGAFKVSGKTNDGVSVAVLQAFTRRESAEVTGRERARDVTVEPAGSYSVARVQKDWMQGRTTLGGIVTSTHRWISDPTLAFLPSQSTTGGMDVVHYFGNRSWLVDANAAFSRVTGDREAITSLQQSPVHYFQRIGADHLGVDERATSISGHGGAVKFGRSGKGRFRVSDRFHWYSPGFDLNDVGYLRQADLMANTFSTAWSEPAPRGPFRQYSFTADREDVWDFGGVKTHASTAVTASGQLTNKWTISGGGSMAEFVDTRALRGGPALRLSDARSGWLSGGTNSSLRVSASARVSREQTTDGNGHESRIQGSVKLRPTDRILLTLTAGHTWAEDDTQYVATVSNTAGTGWMLGRINQDVWDMTLRANLTLTPEFTLQYYGSPFIAVGHYADFKRATNTLAAQYEQRFRRVGTGELTYDAASRQYTAAEGPGGFGSYTFADPDFSFRQFRSNLVARWEYKPGSSIYVVWAQGRTGYDDAWDGAFRSNWREMWRAESDNVLMVKLSYWFSR
jgi:hypothetical protein